MGGGEGKSLAAEGDARPADGAPSAVVFQMKNDRDGGVDPVGVGDDADEFPLLPERGELFQRMLKSLFIEGAEAFVEKERVDPHLVPGHPREGERKGETHKKGLSAGKIAGGADFIAPVVIPDVEFQSAARRAGERKVIGKLL